MNEPEPTVPVPVPTPDPAPHAGPGVIRTDGSVAP